MNRRGLLIHTRVILALIGLLCTSGLAGASANLHGLGIVYLHGKASWPGAANGGILSALEDEGAVVSEPEMPWSLNRRYAATYDEAMGEIDAAVAGLNTQPRERSAAVDRHTVRHITALKANRFKSRACKVRSGTVLG